MIHEIDVERQTRPQWGTSSTRTDRDTLGLSAMYPEDEQDKDKGVATLRWGFGLAACMAIALSLALCSAVQAHEIYQGLKNADGKICCNTIDCTPVEHRFTETGVEIFVRGQWYPVNDRYLVSMSPDGRWHACMLESDPEPRCIIPPNGEV